MMNTRGELFVERSQIGSHVRVRREDGRAYDVAWCNTTSSELFSIEADEAWANARMFAAAPRMRDMLRRNMWDAAGFCQECGGYKGEGHMPGCELSALMDETS